MNIIEFKDITVKKANTLILNRINLSIRYNEFVGIIGPNGAGKSTLLNVVAGLERFDGTLMLFGEDQLWRQKSKKRLKIGYVPQLFEIDRGFPINVLETIMTGAIGQMGLFHFSNKAYLSKAYDIMETLRIKHLEKKPIGTLSGGERQKVLLARTLMQKPEILLLDEPTANLDIAVQKEFFDLISDIHKKERCTVLFVTHDFNLLPQTMERIVLLKHGKIIFDGQASYALTGERLASIFETSLETFQKNEERSVSNDR